MTRAAAGGGGRARAEGVRTATVSIASLYSLGGRERGGGQRGGVVSVKTGGGAAATFGWTKRSREPQRRLRCAHPNPAPPHTTSHPKTCTHSTNTHHPPPQIMRRRPLVCLGQLHRLAPAQVALVHKRRQPPELEQLVLLQARRQADLGAAGAWACVRACVCAWVRVTDLKPRSTPIFATASPTPPDS